MAYPGAPIRIRLTLLSGRDFNEFDALQGLINTVLDIRRPKAHEVGTDNSKPSGDVGHDASAVVDSVLEERVARMQACAELRCGIGFHVALPVAPSAAGGCVLDLMLTLINHYFHKFTGIQTEVVDLVPNPALNVGMRHISCHAYLPATTDSIDQSVVVGQYTYKWGASLQGFQDGPKLSGTRVLDVGGQVPIASQGDTPVRAHLHNRPSSAP